MAPGDDATFWWRHAVDRRFGAAFDNARGVVIPSPRPSFRPLPFPRFTRVRATPVVSLRCGHRRATEKVGALSDSALEPSFSAPRAGPSTYTVLARFEDLGLVSHSLAPWGTNEDFGLSTIRGRRSHPNLRPMRSLALERRPFNDRAFDLYGRLCRQGLHSRSPPLTGVGTSRLAPLRRGGSLYSKSATANQ